MEERLQKIIARAGIASRRRAEDLIRTGQVTINGKVVTELGTKADAARDHIKVCGKLLRGAPDRIYLVLNKPSGCVATMSDPEGRRTIRDYLHGVPARVFPAGRLEYNVQGLLLLTNDGEVANRLLQEGARLPQTYWLKVRGRLSADELRARAEQGVRLRVVKPGENPWYEVRLSGKAQAAPGDVVDELRSDLAAAGHPVEKLRRVALGPLELESLQPGEYRLLSAGEAEELRHAAYGGESWRAAASASRAEGAEAAPRRGGREGRRSAANSRSGRFASGRGRSGSFRR